MAASTLVERWLGDGKRLVAAIDRAGIPVDAALWFYFSEPEEWRLVIASPRVEADGPRAVYSDILDVMASMHPPLDFDLVQVMAVARDHPIVATLKKYFVTPSNAVLGNRISRMVLGDIYFEDAYLYRNSIPVGAAARHGHAR